MTGITGNSAGYIRAAVVAVALLLTGSFGLFMYAVAGTGATEGDEFSVRLLSNAKLTDQYGNQVRHKDLKDKLVVVNFFFTTCGGACPMQTSVLRDVQKALDDSVDAVFISVSISPLVDSPKAIAAFIDQHQVNGENWRFARAGVEATEKLMQKLNVTNDREVAATDQIAHSNMAYLFSREGLLMQKYQLLPGMKERLANEMKVLYHLKSGSV